MIDLRNRILRKTVRSPAAVTIMWMFREQEQRVRALVTVRVRTQLYYHPPSKCPKPKRDAET